jgi:hypothetical protein
MLLLSVVASRSPIVTGHLATAPIMHLITANVKNNSAFGAVSSEIFQLLLNKYPYPVRIKRKSIIIMKAETDFMDLAHYFENTEGVGVLATCDPADKVDQAIYSKPFVLDESTVAFVMQPKTSHHNLQGHLKASYLFIEKDAGYKGIRLHLTKQREEKNSSLVEVLREKQPCIYSKNDEGEKFLVIFEVNQIRPLVGDKFPD